MGASFYINMEPLVLELAKDYIGKMKRNLADRTHDNVSMEDLAVKLLTAEQFRWIQTQSKQF